MPNPALIIISILILLGFVLLGWKMIGAFRRPRRWKANWHQKRINKHLRRGHFKRLISQKDGQLHISYVNPKDLDDREWDPSHYLFSNIFLDEAGKATNPVRIDRMEVEDAAEESDDPAYKIEPSRLYAVKTGQTWIEQAFSKGLKQWVIGGAIAAGMAAFAAFIVLTMMVQNGG